MQSTIKNFGIMIDSQIKYLSQGLSYVPSDRWDWFPEILVIPSANSISRAAIDLLFISRTMLDGKDAPKHVLLPIAVDQFSACSAIEQEATYWTGLLSRLCASHLMSDEYSQECWTHEKKLLENVLEKIIIINSQIGLINSLLGLSLPDLLPNDLYESMRRRHE